MGMKLEFQPYVSPQGWYSLKYPEYWEMEVIENIPTFYDPEGAGAVVITAFENKVGNYDPKIEIIRFLSHHGIKYEEDKIAILTNKQGSVIQTCEFISKDRYWFVYMMSFKDKLLILTYNSEETPEHELSLIIHQIVNSIYFKVEEY